MSDTPRPRYCVPGLPLLGLLLIAVGSLATPRAAQAESTITCESANNNYNRCRADTRGGVTLVTQLSKSGCYQGNTWGYDSRFIWVSNGCRAVFRTGTAGYEHHDKDADKAGAAIAGVALLALGAAAAHAAHEDHKREQYEDHYSYRYDERDYDHHNDRYDRGHQLVTCESHNNQYSYCRANIRHAHVRLVRQHSSSSCRFHEDWGYNRSGIWVENGCRATFEIER